MLLVAFAPEGNAAIPFLIAAQLVLGFAVVDLQHRPGQLPTGDLPARLQGRMNSVMRFIVWGTIPLGTLLGGALGDLGRSSRDDRRSARSAAASRSSGSSSRPSATCATCQSRSTTPSPSPRPPNLASRMPELPEVEAWVRELDPLVSRAPDREGRPRAHRDAEDVRAAALGARRAALRRARAGAGRTSCSRSKATNSSFACTS